MSNEAILDDLWKRLMARNQRVQLARDYAELGRYRSDFFSQKLRDAFAQTLRIYGRNVAKHVVDLEADRLVVAGFQTGDKALDERAWSVWRGNGLDSLIRSAFFEAIMTGQSYISADPNGAGPGKATLHVESSAYTYVEVDPATRRRVAAIKVFQEPVVVPDIGHSTEHVHAFLFLPDVIEEYVSKDALPVGTTITRWAEPEWTLVSSQPNPIAPTIPIVPLLHEPNAVTREGTSLVLPLIEAIDYLHGLIVSQAVSAEMNAFPRIAVTGVEIPKDETGKPLPALQLESSQSRLWAFETENAKVDSLPPGDLSNFGDAIIDQVRLLASLSRSPQHALIIDLVNVSDAALVTSEGPFTAKVEAAQASFGRGLRDALEIALGLDDDADVHVEPLWRPAARFSPVVMAKAAIGEAALGLPSELVWQRLGIDPRAIAAAADEDGTPAPATIDIVAPTVEVPKP
jgi:hypothetical protein